MGETEDERESAPLVVEAESKQLDTSPLLAAIDALDYSLQTTNRQDPTLMQPILLAPPTLHLQSNETPSLNSTSPIANHRSMYTSKTVLKVNGNLKQMAARWTEEEWTNRRRIVHFSKSQDGDILNVDSKAVPVTEIPANSICISCICSWKHLASSSIEKKNRLLHNLDDFHPQTISGTKNHTSGLFKTVMDFGHPRPRDMEMDFKMLPWNCLEPMLKTTIRKYSFMSSETKHGNPERERELDADDTPAASSELSGFCPGRPGTFLRWLEDTLFSILKDLDADNDVRERLLGVLPDLLRAFALKIGYNMPTDAHHAAEYFVEKYRQEANNAQE
ncbi:hypothetical protein TGAM01_v203405 [Trichoderma gamsii]|uniref:DUF7082 domain-containing protein n=1 Tax=Trichoderma gamsii TaxID=398673 RepID=A0A2P4ZTN7_9HYPO|nr:hypothetical protein TGAM01_v203405 [Trichoderma gamsii]PON27638.1 hypothetical protein TGAM01_v203405 [Trichoderma gamsii]